MRLVQTKLASGNERMVCWIPRDPRVKVGSIISLAKSEQRWRVLEQYGSVERETINRRWPVGGLG